MTTGETVEDDIVVLCATLDCGAVATVEPLGQAPSAALAASASEGLPSVDR